MADTVETPTDSRSVTLQTKSAPARSSSEGGFQISTEGASIMGIVGAGAGVALAGYLIAVALQGNLSQLWKLLLTEEPYLEFVVAIIIVWALMKYGPTSEITDLLVVGAVAAVALKLAGRLNVGTALDSFASGKTGILATIETIFKQNTSATITGG